MSVSKKYLHYRNEGDLTWHHSNEILGQWEKWHVLKNKNTCETMIYVNVFKYYIFRFHIEVLIYISF